MSRRSTSPSLRTKHEGPSEPCVASGFWGCSSPVHLVWWLLVQPQLPPAPPRSPEIKAFVARLRLGPPPCLQTASPRLTMSVIQGRCRYPSQ